MRKWQKGYIIQYPNCIMAEVEPAIALLREKTDLKIVDLFQLPNVIPDFLLVPGGSCEHAIVHAELHSLIRSVNDKGGLIGGICNGALVLASAGILRERECTHTAVPKYAPVPEFQELLEIAGKLFAGSVYVDEDVVCSRNIVTAKPSAAQEFAKTFTKKLGL